MSSGNEWGGGRRAQRALMQPAPSFLVRTRTPTHTPPPTHTHTHSTSPNQHSPGSS